jgi:hypothetical protein
MEKVIVMCALMTAITLLSAGFPHRSPASRNEARRAGSHGQHLSD